MKNLLLILLTTLVFCSFAQDFKRFQIGVNFSPEMAYRFLPNDPTVQAGLKGLEIPKFGFTTGINFCYNITSVFGIETGLQYSNKGWQMKKQDLIFESNLNGFSWTPTGDYYKIAYAFHYIDIPVKANFTVGKKKVRFFTSIGLVASILVQETSSLTMQESGKTTKTTKNSYDKTAAANLSPMLSLGIDYKINSKMNLRVEPTARFGVLNNVYLYNAGINLAYYFGL
ncbi:MAG TPA: porin family protein [Chitinophagales bacterium]